MKTLFLVPSGSGLYGPLYKMARKATKGRNASIMVNFEKALERIQRGVFNKVVIMSGAKICRKTVMAKDIYDKVTIFPVKTVLVDSWDWHVPEQVVTDENTRWADLIQSHA